MPEKKKILFFPFPLQSHYLRCIAFAHTLGNEYEILFASGKNYDAEVLKNGFSLFECENFDAEKVMACSQNFDFSWLNLKDIEKVFLQQCQVIKSLSPAEVYGDTSPTLKMATEYCKIPFTAIMNAYMSPYYAFTRQVPRSHKAYPLLQKLKPAMANAITNFAEKAAFKKVHTPFRKLRKKYGLKKVSSYIFETQGDKNLLCDTEELFPQKNLPENYHFIGPLFYRPQQAENVSLKMLLGNGKKNVLVCMGSSGNWPSLNFLCTSAYGEFNVITAGDKQKTLQARHIHAFDFVDLDDALPNCAVLICHGGNGTIHYGLKHKTPMFFFTAHFEQEWNAKRIEDLGLGKTINGLSSQEILSEIKKQL